MTNNEDSLNGSEPNLDELTDPALPEHWQVLELGDLANQVVMINTALGFLAYQQHIGKQATLPGARGEYGEVLFNRDGQESACLKNRERHSVVTTKGDTEVSYNFYNWDDSTIDNLDVRFGSRNNIFGSTSLDALAAVRYESGILQTMTLGGEFVDEPISTNHNPEGDEDESRFGHLISLTPSQQGNISAYLHVSSNEELLTPSRKLVFNEDGSLEAIVWVEVDEEKDVISFFEQRRSHHGIVKSVSAPLTLDWQTIDKAIYGDRKPGPPTNPASLEKELVPRWLSTLRNIPVRISYAHTQDDPFTLAEAA